MNFIALTLSSGERCLINLNNIIAIETVENGTQSAISDLNGEYVVVRENLDEIQSTIETMQRRNGR